MFPLVFAIVLSILAGFTSQQTIDFSMKGNKIFRFYTFMTPCEQTIKEAYIENVSVTRRGAELLVNYDFHLSANVQEFKAEVFFSRCSSREALDSCVTLPPLSTNQGCKFITAPNSAWTSLVNCSTPKVTCPIKKGLYKYRNCKLDLTLYNFMPLGRSYWRVKNVMTIRNKSLCFKSEGMVIN